MATITIVVPVYNVEAYLDRCVQSILNQTFGDFELVLVDDGSPDNCPAMCDEYVKQDNRVVVIHQENGGLSAARNTGIDWAIANSDSEWLTFIDSDDQIHQCFLETLLMVAQDNAVNISMCTFCYPVKETDIPYVKELPVTIMNTEEVYCQYHLPAVSASCKLYRKTLFKDVRYPKGKIHEDMYITYQLLFQQPYIAFVDAPMYCYFQSETSITRGHAWTIRRLDAIAAHENAISFFKENGYENALKFQTYCYIKSLANNIWGAQNHGLDTAIIKALKQKLREAMRKYRKLGGIIDSNEDRYILEIMHPAKTKCKEYLCVVLRKFGLMCKR